MDILKVLSRGIKSTGSKGANGTGNNTFLPTGAATLPSAGSSANPQLYHDPVALKTSRKRKAATAAVVSDESGSDDENNDDDDDDLNELDFFSERKTDPKPAKAKKQKRVLEKKTAALLEEDACRQILRSHRLKLTVLADRKGVVEAAAAAAAEAAAEQVVEKQRRRALKGKAELDTAKLAKKMQKARDEAAAEATKQAKDDAKKQLFPQPLTAFSQLRQTYNLSARLADNLDRLLYKIPTEVQMGSLPLLLDPSLALAKTTFGEEQQQQDVSKGIDFMAVAPTGSGKTLSFLVPAINSILKRRAEEKDKADEKDVEGKNAKRKNNAILDTIVVAPTRELAHQIANEGKKLAVGTGVRVVDMRKGMRLQTDKASEEEEDDDEDNDDDEEEEEDDDEDNPAKTKVTVTRTDILVTTPLMLLNTLREHLTGPAKHVRLKEVLPTVRTLVLDEADVLLDPLFRDQTLGIWSACTHPDLRATFWSATMASNIEELIADEMKRRAIAAAVTTSDSASDDTRPLVRLVVGLKDTAVPNVTHKLVYTASEQGKLLAMRQLLHPSTSVSVVGSSSSSAAATSGSTAPTALRPPFLVFTQTAERATALHDELKFDIPAAAGGADRIGVLHAAMADNLRSAVVRKFRAGQVWVLITTDVLARGIDFAGVNGVVNYDVPTSAAAYVHRAGRTGRAGRQGGLSVTLYTKDDIPYVKSVANVIAASEKQAGGKDTKKKEEGIQQWLLDALPEVSKADKKKLKTRGMESRRTINRAAFEKDGNGKDGKKGKPAPSRITSKSAWERRKDNNRRDAIASSKQRKQAAAVGEKGEKDDEEWGGLE